MSTLEMVTARTRFVVSSSCSVRFYSTFQESVTLIHEIIVRGGPHNCRCCICIERFHYSGTYAACYDYSDDEYPDDKHPDDKYPDDEDPDDEYPDDEYPDDNPDDEYHDNGHVCRHCKGSSAFNGEKVEHTCAALKELADRNSDNEYPDETGNTSTGTTADETGHTCQLHRIHGERSRAFDGEGVEHAWAALQQINDRDRKQAFTEGIEKPVQEHGRKVEGQDGKAEGRGGKAEGRDGKAEGRSGKKGDK